jgi:16S rRNA (adenine1518-N6/adenine1519-N6)-dimethyltransferase
MPQHLGQHFLIDTAVIEREISYATLTPDDIVLEIGPGKGALTQQLAQKAREVLAIELDQKMIDYLSGRLPNNVRLIKGDAVKLDFTRLPRFTKVVANLPFWISSNITIKLLDYHFEKAILIYQWEYAKRLTAGPGSKDYGRLSVLIAYKTQCRLLERIPRSSFAPPPEVDAAIIELIPRSKPAFSVKDEAFFFNLTHKLFSHRRKKIKTTLRSLTPNLDDFPFLDNRVEDLSPGQIGHLSDLLFEKRQQKFDN